MKKKGFTIIELLTVMSIIILLMGLFVPALNRVRQYARRVAQHNQLHAIGIGLAMFNAELQEYPEPLIGGGAITLAESLVGCDLLGYDPDGKYDLDDISDRREYLSTSNANFAHIYNDNDAFDPNIYILSDVYPHITHPDTGRLIGMPVLYYKANVSNRFHSKDDADIGKSIYDYRDNHDFVALLDIPSGDPGEHALVTDPAATFYERSRSTIVDYGGVDIAVPYRPDSYILLSAGFDGQYGTDDDVYNFNVK